MAVFKAYDPKVEVTGENVKAFLDGVGAYAYTVQKMLSESGIKDAQPGKWYPQQSYLDGLKLVAAKTGPGVLKSIGKSIPENAKWPPQVNSVESGLASIDMAYKMNHRNGKIGNYTFTKTTPHSATMVCDNPYPDYFDFGIIESVARKFSKPGEHVFVKMDESKSRRDSGAESTTYVIEW